MSQKTVVVNCRKDDYDVFIGRPSIWGNPFKEDLHGTRKEVIEMYRQYLLDHPYLLALAKEQLTGMILGCYCKPKPCHGDVLVELLNEDRE
jgi:hypothetical protein